MKTGHGADGPLGRAGRLAGPAAEPENAVLTDQARVVRWAGPAFLACSLVLLPWTVYLAVTLPASAMTANYGPAWAGFDVLLMATLAATGYFALRRSRYLALTSAAAAALLVVDAWFDCMTTPWPQRGQSLLLAAFVELPLAAVCLWLSYHTLHIAERRIILLQRRQRAVQPRRGLGAWARRGQRDHHGGGEPGPGGT